MDVSLDVYMRKNMKKGLNSSKRGRQSGMSGRGRGRGQGRVFGGRGKLTAQRNIGQNKQVQVQGGGRNVPGGNRQFGRGNKRTAGNISSRLGVKNLSPMQKIQQKRQALRKAANRQGAGVKRILGNRQIGFTTMGNVATVAGKGQNNTVFDARQNLERKLKITDARQKILSKSKPQGADARAMIQSNLAKKALKGLVPGSGKKKTVQNVQKNKTIVDAAIPKVVLKNLQGQKIQPVTFEDTETSLLSRTVENTVAMQRGIPVKTVNINTAASQQSPRGLGRTMRNRGNRGRGGKNIVLTRTVNQSVGLRAALGLEGDAPLRRSVPGNLHMDDPNLLPTHATALASQPRAVSRSSMLITARNVEPEPQVQYMDEDEEPYGSGPLILGRDPPQKEATFIRIANDQYQQPARPKVRILPPTKPKKPVHVPVPVIQPEEEEIVVSPLQGYKVLVTNLHPIVTQDDIIELFGSLGALKRARIVKKGQAEVVFVNKDDALNAVKKYHNRELDALPMQLKLVTPIPTKDLSTPVFRLPKSSTTTEGPKEKIDLDMDVVHRALFKTGLKNPGAPPPKPVTFTVKI